MLKKLDQNCLNKKVQKNQSQVKMFMDNKGLVLMEAKACDDKKAKDINTLATPHHFFNKV